MYCWKLAVTVVLALLLGAGAAFVWDADGAKAKADSILAAKTLADRKKVPDLDAVQATYDFELMSGNTAHEQGLKLVKAQCLKGQETSYICFISFVMTTDPDGHIYNGVTEIVYAEDTWLLKAGICTRGGGGSPVPAGRQG